MDLNPVSIYDVTQAFPLWKVAAPRLWLAGQSHWSRYLKHYEALSIVRGALIGTDHASAFAA